MNGTWQLEGHNGVLSEGTEAQVKARAQHMLAGKDENQEASLREALFVTRPDGTHQGQGIGDGTFMPGEAIEWIDVEW
jgi:hypothetical protein